jgi:hypothetical protein
MKTPLLKLAEEILAQLMASGTPVDCRGQPGVARVMSYGRARNQ